MTLGDVVALLREGIFELFVVVTPVLAGTIVVGLIISILQAATSIQEQTLTFVPKLITILGLIALLGGWMISRCVEYTRRLFLLIPDLG